MLFIFKLFDEEILKPLIQTRKNQKFVRLHLDATGGLVEKPYANSPNVVNHSIILPIKTNPKNIESELIPVAELITCNQTSLNIEIFLRKLIAAVKRRTKVYENLSDYIIIDCSFAEMNAITNCYGLKICEYLNILFKASEEKSLDSLDKISIIGWCSSHFTKIVVKDVKAAYPSKAHSKLRGLIVELVVELMDIKSFEEQDSFIKNILILLKKENVDEEVLRAEVSLSVHFQDSEIDENSDEIDELEFESEESKTLYKSSPFFQKYSTYFDSISESESGPPNKFFNQEFGKIVLKKYVAFIPFFGGPYMRLDHFKTRPNNGAVERFFGLEKKDNKLKHFGVLKPERIGNFIRNRKKKLEIIKKKVRIQLHSKCLVIKAAEEIPEDSQDNWKNRNNTCYHSKKRVTEFFVKD